MQIRFWGTRGSIPTPGPGTVRFGGNTSCIEVRTDDGTRLVLDCGTGARALGQEVLAESARTGSPATGSVLIGHTHWDHIQGLPFFSPLFQPGSRWDLYGPRGLGPSLAETLSGQMQYQYFPVSLDQLGAEVAYHDLVEGTFDIGDVTIRTKYLNHPALTLGYRIEADGGVVVYAADHEPHDPALAGGGDLRASPEDARHVDFLEGADVVVHDAQYLASEYAAKLGWGHSTVEYALAAAQLAGVGHLVLHHHDPIRDDDALDRVVDGVRARALELGWHGTVDAAAEGTVVEVTPRARRTAAARRPGVSAVAAPAVEDMSASVVVALADPDLESAVRTAAQAEDLPVRLAGAGRQLVELVDRAGRAVVVVDLDGDRSALDLLQRSVDVAVSTRVAVLGLTRLLLSPQPGIVTDLLVWPSSVAHVRTKLRAAVLRRACRWQAAPLPPDEETRVRSLRSLGILDTPPEERFDRYTEMACEALAVPVALVSLVDTDRQWFKSRRGIDAQETPRDQSLCAHAILGREVFQVPDLLEDPRFADNPAAAGVRFYAGVPLVLSDGSAVGTLCVVDHRPRELDEAQLDELRRLGALVEAELENAAGD